MAVRESNVLAELLAHISGTTWPFFLILHALESSHWELSDSPTFMGFCPLVGLQLASWCFSVFWQYLWNHGAISLDSWCVQKPLITSLRWYPGLLCSSPQLALQIIHYDLLSIFSTIVNPSWFWACLGLSQVGFHVFSTLINCLGLPLFVWKYLNQWLADTFLYAWSALEM